MDKFVQITEDMFIKGDVNISDYLIKEVRTIYNGSIIDIETVLDETLIFCESPIEQLFMLCWKADGLGWKRTPYIEILCEEQQHEMILDNIKMRIDLYLEYHLKNFNGESKLLKIAVEFDGHEFHKSTKEQVSKDNERNIILQKNDINVIRFSGSDIWNDLRKQIKRLDDFIWTKHYQYLKGE